MTAILALSGFACSLVVLIVERTAAKNEEKQAFHDGYLRGYGDATKFQNPGYEE